MPLGLNDLPERRILSRDVQIALDHLFDVFSRYAPRDLSPDWHDFWHPAEQAEVDSLPVRQLSEDLMGYVLANVVSVYGDTPDLKYFLPRLLEIAIQKPMREEATAVLHRANQTELRSWPEPEFNSVCHFVLAWWRQALQEPVKFNSFPVDDVLCAASFAFDDLGALLDEWAGDLSLNATLHIMNTARLNLHAENGEAQLILETYWEDRPVQTAQVRAWLLSPAVLARLQAAAAQVQEEPARELLIETTERLGQIAAR